MTAFRLFAVAALLTATLGACGRSEEPGAGSGPSNPLLSYVPDDTPYLAANLAPLPGDVVDAYLARMQPALDEAQAQLTLMRTELEAEQAGATGQSGADTTTRLALAVLRELDGKLSRAGLSALGLDMVSHKVVYGLGAFPVIRTGLSDADALRATIQRVLDDAGVSAPEQSYQGVAFWRLPVDLQEAIPVALYVSIIDDHLAVGILPPAFETELLPGFLGVTMPAVSHVGDRLAELNRAQGYTAYGSGILDLHGLADQFLQADSVTARVMAATGAYDAGSITPDCVTEIHEIIDNAPRMTLGTTELSTAAIAYQYRVETPVSLAGQLARLVSRLPAADAGSDRMLDLSFGVSPGAVRDFLREKTSAIVEDPYRCEHLQDLNTSTAESLARLDQPMPPFLNNFRGLRISLSEIAFGHSTLPEKARGHLALHVEQPEMFVGMAQMFLPDLSGLAIKPGADPVQLPDSLIPAPGLVAFAAMSGDAIGLSVGSGEEATLPEFLDAPTGPEGMFFSASYDTSAYLNYRDELVGPVQQDDGDPLHAAQAIGMAARHAFSNMADRSYTTLRFGADGVVIDERMSFKP